MMFLLWGGVVIRPITAPFFFERVYQVTEREILELRKATNPIPVRLHHVPKWFRLKLGYWLKLHGMEYLANDPLNGFMRVTGWRLDHFGSSEKGTVFVNEPYGNRAAENARVAEMLFCDFRESPNSYWYPGRTSRYEFRHDYPMNISLSVEEKMEPIPIPESADQGGV